MIKRILLILMLFFISSTAYAEETIKASIEKNANLSMNNCIDIALQNNPEIRSLIYQSVAQKSKIGQEKANYLPQINLGSGYNVFNNSDNSGTNSSSDNLSAEISLSQLIWDFGKTTNKIKAQKFSYDASLEEVRNIVNNIVYSVKEAYYTVLYNMQNIEVHEEAVQMYEKQLEQTRSYYEKGFKSKIDVITAEYNLSNSKLDLIKAKNDLKTSMAALNKSMGISDLTGYTLIDKLDFDDYEIGLDEALKLAAENRPDLKQADLNIKSAERTLKTNKSEYLPSLSAVSGYGVGGTFPLDSSWSVGASFSMPVFNGFSIKNKVNEARALLKSKHENSKTIRQSIVLEVNESYYTLMETKEKLPVSELMVEQGKERYNLAQKRYAVGIGDVIELKDAEVEYRNSKLEYVKTLYDYNVALATLKKAIGIDIPDFQGSL